MASSVNEIGRRVQESARMANEAVDQARSTTDRVSELSKAAARIGDVVELINTIAGQTNLLALNATNRGVGRRHQGDQHNHRKTVGDFVGDRGRCGPQGAATQEISLNVQQAAHGTQQVSSNITDVQRGGGAPAAPAALRYPSPGTGLRATDIAKTPLGKCVTDYYAGTGG
jgi:methyl-accepting chemotaxis protein